MTTAHVLEHVPDTDRALTGLWRVVKPCGNLLLSAPILSDANAPSAEPEDHGDNTLAFYHFGFDLTERLRGHGFTSSVLVTTDFKNLVAKSTSVFTETSSEFVAPSIFDGANVDDMVASQSSALLLGPKPAYMFVVSVYLKRS